MCCAGSAPRRRCARCWRRRRRRRTSTRCWSPRSRCCGPRRAPPYAEHTLVDQAVTARANACRRAPASSTRCCVASCASARRWSRRCSAIRWRAFNHPAWWIERVRHDWPAQWQAMLAEQAASADDVARQRAARQRARLRRAAGRARHAARVVGAHAVVLGSRGRWRSCPASSTATCRCRTPPRSAPRRCCSATAARSAPPCAARSARCLRRARRQDRAPARAGRPRPAGARWRAERLQRVRETLQRLGLQATLMPATRATPRAGGTGGRSTPCCSTRRAAPRASCAAIRTCAGCAGQPTCKRWRACRRSCSTRCGRCWRPAAGCCTPPARSSVPREAQIDAFLQRRRARAPRHPASPGHLLPLPDNPHEGSTPAVGASADGFFYALIHKA